MDGRSAGWVQAPRGRAPLWAFGGAMAPGRVALRWARPLLAAAVCSPVCRGASRLFLSLHEVERRSSSEHGNSPRQGCPGYSGLPRSLISATLFHEVTA